MRVDPSELHQLQDRAHRVCEAAQGSVETCNPEPIRRSRDLIAQSEALLAQTDLQIARTLQALIYPADIFAQRNTMVSSWYTRLRSLLNAPQRSPPTSRGASHLRGSIAGDRFY